MISHARRTTQHPRPSLISLYPGPPSPAINSTPADRTLYILHIHTSTATKATPPPSFNPRHAARVKLAGVCAASSAVACWLAFISRARSRLFVRARLCVVARDLACRAIEISFRLKALSLLPPFFLACSRASQFSRRWTWMRREKERCKRSICCMRREGFKLILLRARAERVCFCLRVIDLGIVFG